MQHWLFESKMIVQADAFTHEQFSGNPAAVCLLDADVAKRLSNERLQQVAAEYQQPATAFLAVHDQDADFRTSTSFTLSWFTTTTELPLCGHGTIAAAAVLFQECANQHATLHFETQKGLVSVTKLETVDGLMMQSKLPEAKAVQELPTGLKLDNESLQTLVGTLPVQEVLYNDTRGILMIVLATGASRAQLEALNPDLQLLQSRLIDDHLSGVAVTCQGDGQEHHFLSRYWAPWLGVREDAVTGSLHTVLTPYWDAVLQMQGKPMKARQCSARGGELQVSYVADEKAVYLAGQAVIVGKGHITVPLSRPPHI